MTRAKGRALLVLSPQLLGSRTQGAAQRGKSGERVATHG